ncbi:MAG: TM2 domain-containing protein, partial [Cyanobacteriota bacterium]|nr:TM2 domain-containing protein [Cyanobacteriota bacterium]
MLDRLSSQPKNQKLAVLLALAGSVTPLTGLHKFYLRQYGWGVLYLALLATPIPHVASAIEAIWYLLQNQTDFNRRFNSGLESAAEDTQHSKLEPERVGAIATALRELDRLRQ